MRIVIVGGGAGGLELATQLGRKLGRRGKAQVLLIDRNQTHVWKPLLHEVASGSLDAELDAVNYRAHGYRQGYEFELGSLSGIDRERQCVQLSALVDEEGREVLPARERPYDRLVVAIGSVSNDFKVPGVARHCAFLDSPAQAQTFHRRLVDGFIRVNQALQQGDSERKLRVAIVGAGATGVELAAEIHKAREWFATYGLREVTPEHLAVSVIEMGPRILPALSSRIAGEATRELERLGVDVRVDTAVSEAHADGLETDDGQRIEADLMVWAAGVKAPDFLGGIAGLETNGANQIVVGRTLQARGDPRIFALGDCAGYAMDTTAEGRTRWVPPRAQSAHQMAALIARNLRRELADRPLLPFQYRDFGSLVSLSDYNAFGRLMGGLARGGLSLEGRLARLAYVSLYRSHQAAIHGWPRTVLLALSGHINHFVRPRFKLH